LEAGGNAVIGYTCMIVLYSGKVSWISLFIVDSIATCTYHIQCIYVYSHVFTHTHTHTHVQVEYKTGIKDIYMYDCFYCSHAISHTFTVFPPAYLKQGGPPGLNSELIR
jgi:hypothetical protein